jgi:hypothetical protein
MSLTFSETPDHIVIPTRVSLSGYGAVLRTLVINAALIGGINDLDAAPVPAGVLHVYTNLLFHYTGTVLTVTLYCLIDVAGTFYTLLSQLAPDSAVDYYCQGWWVLEEGDILRLRVGGATLGDGAHLCGTGFVVDLT